MIGRQAAPKRRRPAAGTRGGRGHKKKPVVDGEAVAEGGEPADAEPMPEPEPAETRPAVSADGRRPRQPRIHVPATHLGEPDEAAVTALSGNGDVLPLPATGSSGRSARRAVARAAAAAGRGRRSPAPTAPRPWRLPRPSASPCPAPPRERKLRPRALRPSPFPRPSLAPAAPPASSDYVPMSEWLDDPER